MNVKKMARLAQIFNFGTYLDQGAVGNVSRLYKEHIVQDTEANDRLLRETLERTKSLIIGFDVRLPVMPGRAAFFDFEAKRLEPMTVTRKAIKMGADDAIFQAIFNQALTSIGESQLGEATINFGKFLAKHNVVLSNKANAYLFGTLEWDYRSPETWVKKRAMVNGEVCCFQVRETVQAGEGRRHMGHVEYTIKLS